MIRAQPRRRQRARRRPDQTVQKRVMAQAGRLTGGQRVSQGWESPLDLARTRVRGRRPRRGSEAEPPALSQTKFVAVSELTPSTVTCVLSVRVKLTPPVTLACEARMLASALLA